MVIFAVHDTDLVSAVDSAHWAYVVTRLLVYRRDIQRIRQICEVKMITAGSLWCEIMVTQQDADVLRHHGIWYETQGVRA